MKILIKYLIPSFKYLVIIAILFKLLILGLSSYPFDFATYVYQARSYFEYSINPLFSWNKGMPLLYLFYTEYSIYQLIISFFNSNIENTIILHIVYKLPLFLFDLLTAYTLYKIILLTTNNKKISKLIILAWLFNPIVFWFTEVHGSYAVIATYFSILSLYLILKKKNIASIFTLALSVSIYYYAATLLPFYLIYIITEKRRQRLKSVLLAITIFFLSIFFFYSPFLFTEKTLFLSFVGSVVHHAAPDASSFTETIKLPDYSILKIPYYYIFHRFPQSNTDPLIFNIAKLSTFLGLIVIIFYSGFRLLDCFKKNSYSYYLFIKDLLVTTTVFLLLVGKFQDHYILWLLPYMLLYSIVLQSKQLVRNTFIISFIVFINICATQNINVFFLDVLRSGTINFYLPQPEYTRALSGFTVILFLLSNLFFKQCHTKHNSKFSILDYVIIGVVTAFFLTIFFIQLITYNAIIFGNQKSYILGSDNNVYNIAYISSPAINTHIKTDLDYLLIEDNSFEKEPQKKLNSNTKINSKSIPWFFYNYKGGNGIEGYISNYPHYGKYSLVIQPIKSNVAAQINMGGNGSNDLIPVTSSKLYDLSVFIIRINLSTNQARATIRFADKDRNIIPGSDLRLKTESTDGLWVKESARFVPTNEAKYMDILFTVDLSRNEKLYNPSYAVVDDYMLNVVNNYSQITLDNVIPKENSEGINKYVLNQTTAYKFLFNVSIYKPLSINKIVSVKLNDCEYKGKPLLYDDYWARYTFKSSCIMNKQNNNTIELILNNYESTPITNLSLTHISQNTHEIKYHKITYILLLTINGILGIIGLALLINRCVRKLKQI